VTQLTSLQLAGWKSIRDAKIDFRSLNILIGANGAGKSNLVSFFQLIQDMRKGHFQVRVGTSGGAESLLHYGSKRTPFFEADFRFATNVGRGGYAFRLVTAAGNTLIFDMENLTYYIEGGSIGEEMSGQRETSLNVLFDLDDTTLPADQSGKFIYEYLTHARVFHFHDTSPTGPMRKDCSVDANRFLASDAANLPAMLYLYRQRYPTAYQRIVAAVKAVAPFFEDFVLEPLRLNPRNIALSWRSKQSDYDFGPHQLSDGTLRAIALFTLLLQPEEDLPPLIVLDEPELGLHPSALSVLADLLKSAARHCQLLIATQSTALIDHFEAADVITVNLRDGCSTFERLDPERLKEWLEKYTLSELWERNVFGGGPY
jgi:predicted ATPase